MKKEGLAVDREEALMTARGPLGSRCLCADVPVGSTVGNSWHLATCQVTQVAARSKGWTWPADGGLFGNTSSFILNLS